MNEFKLGILVPLKARAVSSNWGVVEDCLKSVLVSLNKQNEKAFECAVVGHDEPVSYSINEVCQNAKFIKFDEFTPPDKSEKDKYQLQLKYEFDRCSKIAKGMLELDGNGITHWFALDADDLLHCDFVSIVKGLEDYDSVLIDNGYTYYKQNNILNENNELSAYCGSTCVVRDKLTEKPKLIDIDSYRQTFFGSLSHALVKDEFERANVNYIVPDERLVMYINDTGENISEYYFSGIVTKIKRRIKMSILKVSPADKVLSMFGLIE